jgi:hypothetical protein
VISQKRSLAAAGFYNRFADKPAFCPRSILHADLASLSQGRGIVSAATQHSPQERTLNSPPKDQIYTGRLPQSHDLSGSRTRTKPLAR